MNLEAIPFPEINAGLNSLAALLLLLGYVAVRRGNIPRHKQLMLSAFAVSALFLVSYLTYHYLVGHTEFLVGGPARTVYLTILVSHIVLAVLVPPLAIGTIYLGLKDRRAAHRRLARWTLPIWLYVSVTGVVIYVMLYHLYPPPPEAAIIML